MPEPAAGHRGDTRALIAAGGGRTGIAGR